MNRSKMRILKIFGWDFSMILRSFFEGSDLGRFLWVRLLMIKITFLDLGDIFSKIDRTFLSRSATLFIFSIKHFFANHTPSKVHDHFQKTRDQYKEKSLYQKISSSNFLSINLNPNLKQPFQSKSKINHSHLNSHTNTHSLTPL